MLVAVNLVGARHRCSVVLMLGTRVIGGIGLASRGGVCPVHVCDAIPCLIFQINNFESLGAIII